MRLTPVLLVLAVAAPAAADDDAPTAATRRLMRELVGGKREWATVIDPRPACSTSAT